MGSGAEQPTGDAPDPAVFEDVECLPEVEECTASADEHPSGDEPLEILEVLVAQRPFKSGTELLWLM